MCERGEGGGKQAIFKVEVVRCLGEGLFWGGLFVFCLGRGLLESLLNMGLYPQCNIIETEHGKDHGICIYIYIVEVQPILFAHFFLLKNDLNIFGTKEPKRTKIGSTCPRTWRLTD